MSVTEYRAYLSKGLPPGIKLSGTAVAVLGIILFRYDTREGKKSAYPGMDEFKRATNKARSTIQEALKELLDKGLIVQRQKGYRNFRAEYVPVFIFSDYGIESVGIADTNELSPKVIESDTPLVSEVFTGDMSPISPSKVSEPSDALNTLNTLSTSKYVTSINYERWNVLISELPEGVKKLLKPGSNYEKSLDRCMSNGMRLTEIKRAVSAINFTNSYKVGGLLDDVLQGLAGVKTVRKSKSGLPHCGDTYCDPVTRTFPEPSEIAGRMDNRCRECNEQLINETKRRNDPPPFDLSALQNFGKLPDD
jgi:hypothetical protein